MCKKPFYFLILIIVFLSACSKEIKQEQRLDLNGDWQFNQAGSDSKVKATVPGLVQLDMLNVGLIEDPYYGKNETKIGWIELENWEYERKFELTEDFLQQEVVDLVFEGLDTYAEVRINGKKVLETDNMFCTWRVNCKKELQVGENRIKVLLKSPIKEKEAAYNALGYQLPAGNDAGDVKVSPFVRKAPYQFGWDWGPRIVTMGIWRPVYLEAYSHLKVQDIYIQQKEISTQKATLRAEIELEMLEAADYNIIIRNGEKILAQQAISTPKGHQTVPLDFEIDQPKLWWCQGLGEAHLTTFIIEIKKGDQVLFSQTKKIGLRKIELIQEQDSIGTSYYFKLNDQAVFMKGANYIPQDNLLPRVKKEHYIQTIQDAVDANMNMLRVWGGGIYEDDLFYELCDQKGLLVWQDFMFACGMYPGDAAFLKNVEKEVTQNVKRLRNHACLALWCGNNEMEVAWNNWGWQKQFGYSPEDSTAIITGYQNLFHDLIPSLLEKLKVQQAYVSTSPLSNWGTPENFNHSSMHYWGVWHGREPFDAYKDNVGRFMSEYGFQSFPEMKTIKTFADSSQWKLNSEVMTHHQKSYIGNGMIQQHLERDYPKPINFEDFVYLSQLTQADGVGLAIEQHRHSQGHCMGTLYWQLNDCWPGPSWSSVDYEGNWKALHYRVRDLYKAAIVNCEQSEDSLLVQVHSDKNLASQGALFLLLRNFEGETVHKIEMRELNIPTTNKFMSWKLSLNDILKDYNPKEVFLEVNYLNEKTVLKDLHYFVQPKDLKLKAANLTYDLKKYEEGYLLNIQTNALAKNVFINIAAKGHFNYNYMDLIPGEALEIVFKTTAKISEKDISLRCLNDLME